ncbi:MAG: sigma-54-dependent transcriptional regulator [Shewanella sp.]
MCSVLIVSNNREMAFIDHLLAANYQLTFASCEPSIDAMKADIIILDLQEVECLKWLDSSVSVIKSHAMLLIIASPAQLTLAHTMALIASYAWDYHTAPVDINRLLITLGHMRGILHMRKPYIRAHSSHLDCHPSVSRSLIMQRLQQQLLKVAPTDIPVLITGPSGSGKELVACNIHQYSPRAKGPLVVVNCGAIALGLGYSELFGHEKGAFTGAIQKRQGKLAQADGGTLFLDEIGDLPMDQQTYLLRFLQEGQFDVVGGGVCRADVRVVAATHVDLQSAIAAGRFRLDLFYRLNGVNLVVPSLQERIADLPELAHSLLFEAAATTGVAIKSFSNNALLAMQHYAWPGNVRELKHKLQRALIMSEGRQIEPHALDLPSNAHADSQLVSLTLQHQKDNTERKAIEEALLRVGGKVLVAAKHLNVSRATLYRLLDKYNLQV